jgi:hypothetical protein
MRREGFDVARCTVARLIKAMGIQGVIRGKPVRTTIPDKAAPCPLDRVNRQFRVPAPNMLWVSDFTYVATWKGFVYVAFVIDAFARRSPARRAWLRWGEAGLGAAGAVAVIVLLVPAIQVRATPTSTVDLAIPLGPGTYLVANGGTSGAINAHLMTLAGDRFRPWRGQSYGLDLIGIDRWGRTARGLGPTEPRAYVVYGAEILAPCSGTVIAADGIPNMEVPLMDRENMAGNHVLLSCGENAVLLGHMAPGSVAAGAGDEVATGDLLGRVGNTGNTNAPHLHIHVQRGLPDSALYRESRNGSRSRAVSWSAMTC